MTSKMSKKTKSFVTYLVHLFKFIKVNEYDQFMLQSQTTDQHTTQRRRDIEQKQPQRN